MKMLRVVMMAKMTWQVNEEVNRDKTGEIHLEVDSKDEMVHI